MIPEIRLYGRNEEDDDFSIVGIYLQGKLALAEKARFSGSC